MESIETRDIILPQGGVLNVTMTERFRDVLRRHFKLADDAVIEDDHVRMYMFGAVKSALEKSESERQ